MSSMHLAADFPHQPHSSLKLQLKEYRLPTNKESSRRLIVGRKVRPTQCLRETTLLEKMSKRLDLAPLDQKKQMLREHKPQLINDYLTISSITRVGRNI